MRKSVFLFDVDGVLLNGASFAIQLEKDYGISYEMLQPFFEGPFVTATIGTHDVLELLEPYLAEWKWPHSAEEFLQYWFKAEHKVDQQLVAYVAGLRRDGHKRYLATNQEMYRVQYILESIGFKDSFDGIFASAHLGVKKPDITFFKKLYAQLSDMPKDQIVFWDDTLENVEACKSFGIDAELYINFEDFKKKAIVYA